MSDKLFQNLAILAISLMGIGFILFILEWLIPYCLWGMLLGWLIGLILCCVSPENHAAY